MDEIVVQKHIQKIDLPKEKNHILIIYDITNQKRRTKFATKMDGFGHRVQKSAYEAILVESKLNKLINSVPKLIDPKEDSVRIYSLSGYTKIYIYGKNKIIDEQNTIII